MRGGLSNWWRRVPAGVRRWLRRGTLTVLTLLLVAAGVMTWRTLAMPSRQLPAAAGVLPEVDSGAVGRFAGLLRFRTVASPTEFDPEQFQRLHAYLEESFPRVHAQLEREVVSDCSLLYRWQGSDPKAKPILLMSHLDVVPVPRAEEPLWSHEPWSGEIADGYVWGRGALGVKCGVAGLLEAAEHLLREDFRPHCDVYFAFGHDEEIGGAHGNTQIALRFRSRGVQFRFVLDEGGVIVRGAIPGLDRPLALVAVAEKGYATVRLRVDISEADRGHSSMPPRETAVSILSAAVAKVQAEQRPAGLSGPVGLMLDAVGPEMNFPQRFALANRDVLETVLLKSLGRSRTLNALSRTTTAATVFHGGQHEGSLPGHAEASVNFRLIPGENPELILRHVRDVVADERVECELRPEAFSASYVSDHESEDFRTIHRLIRRLDDTIVVAPGLAVVATDSRHYEGLTENTYRFLPLRLSTADLSRIHGVDERIAVENYRELVQFMIRLLRDTAGAAEETMP